MGETGDVEGGVVGEGGAAGPGLGKTGCGSGWEGV